jgi:hypothetical protein
VNAATSRASERARQSASAAWAREAVCVARSVIARWSHLAGGQPRPACERLAYEELGDRAALERVGELRNRNAVIAQVPELFG